MSQIKYPIPDPHKYGGIRRRPAEYRSNWDKIRNDYIFADPIIDKDTTSIRYPTLGEIGQQNNVSEHAIRQRSSREGWVEKRKLYQERVKQLHDLEVGALALRRSALFDSENLERLANFTKTFDKWLAELDEKIEAQNGGGYRDPEEEVTPVTGRDLKDAVDVMGKMHKLHRDILGEPVNYYEFYREKLKEERNREEKGAKVTRNEIRDLISAVREERSNERFTLDVSAEEENSLRIVTNEMSIVTNEMSIVTNEVIEEVEDDDRRE